MEYPFPGPPKTPGDGTTEPDLSPTETPSGELNQHGEPQDQHSSLAGLYIEAYASSIQAVQEDRNGDHHTARLLYCEVCEVRSILCCVLWCL